MIHRYWESIGGTLIEEFEVTSGGPFHARRRLDAVIIKNGRKQKMRTREVDVNGKDIIIVQAKNSRLGMYLAGQVIFSKKYMEKFFKPGSVEAVALCTKNDAILQSFLNDFPGISVAIDQPAGFHQ